MFDVANGWGDNPPFGVPSFVLTHRGQEKLVKGATTFTFVTDRNKEVRFGGRCSHLPAGRRVRLRAWP